MVSQVLDQLGFSRRFGGVEESAGELQVLSVTISAAVASISSLNVARSPRRTIGRAEDQSVSVRHLIDDFKVRWNRPTRPFV